MADPKSKIGELHILRILELLSGLIMAIAILSVYDKTGELMLDNLMA
jgi:hypothetical protein